jgi:U3 small nucleolar RNA-associated protein 11
MGGGDGSLRHVVHKRVHLERHQPKQRKKLGYLEKHKDYVLRAKDFHRKQDKIKKLQRKAYFKNEEEFSRKMVNMQIKDGRARKKVKGKTQDEVALLDSQDAVYVGMRERADKKAAKRAMENLHFLDAEKNNKHVLFLDEDELQNSAPSSSSSIPSGKKKRSLAKALQEYDVAAHFDTDPALLGQKSNRLRKKQLDTQVFADAAETCKGSRASYRMLLAQQERGKKLELVRSELELRHHLRQKGRRRKVADAVDGRPAVYKWEPERKR